MKTRHHTLNIIGYLMCMGLFFAFIFKERPDALTMFLLSFFFPYYLTGYFIDCSRKIEAMGETA
jgi:hypothetical protein